MKHSRTINLKKTTIIRTYSFRGGKKSTSKKLFFGWRIVPVLNRHKKTFRFGKIASKRSIIRGGSAETTTEKPKGSFATVLKSPLKDDGAGKFPTPQSRIYRYIRRVLKADRVSDANWLEKALANYLRKQHNIEKKKNF